MTVNERLAAAINANDIDAFVECFHDDYQSEQPAHRDRAFGGRAQVRQNWSAIFRDVPRVAAELDSQLGVRRRGVGEWRFVGTRRDGTTMDMRGVIINGVRDGRIAWARLYLEVVEEGGRGIRAAVERITDGSGP
jgi:ketosteroid isomerase-like protein